MYQNRSEVEGEEEQGAERSGRERRSFGKGGGGLLKGGGRWMWEDGERSAGS